MVKNNEARGLQTSKKGSVTAVVISPYVISLRTTSAHHNWIACGRRGPQVIFQQTASFLQAATGTLSSTAAVPHLLAPSAREVRRVVG